MDEKIVKVYQIKVLNNAKNKFSDTAAENIEDNLKEVCKSKKMSVEKVLYLVALHFLSSGLADGVLFHLLAVFFYRADK